MYIGCDVGRFYDYTALIGVNLGLDQYEVVKAVIFQGKNFRQQANIIAEIAQDNKLYIDCTGIGRGLFELLQPLCKVKPVLIRPGVNIKFHRDGFSAGKQALMQILGLAMPNLRVSDDLPSGIRAALRRQLGGMVVKPGKIPKYSASKASVHDDLVLALALALLGAQFDG